MTEKIEQKGNKGGIWRPVLLIAAVIAVLIASSALGLGDKIGSLKIWIEAQGALGPLIFVLVYVLATVAALPGSALTLAAGALFGSVLGVGLVSIASTLGASLSFLIGRYFARDAIAGRLADKPAFARLDALTEMHGAVIVALTRLVPIFPFNLLNYGFGLTRVRFRTYAFWSWLCMLPGTIIYVIGADAISKGLEQGQIPWALVFVALAAVAVLAGIVRHASKVLKGKQRQIDSISIDRQGSFQ